MKKHGPTDALVVLGLVLLAASGSAEPAASDLQGDYHLAVDATVPGEQANRALFSWVNYQRFSSESTPESIEALLALNPAGTQARTEIMIDLLEPANDNDDPSVFDWDRLNVNAMYRFISNDDGEFYREILDLQMEPIALLTYNVEWLGRGGSRTAPPTSNEEWAEFAAAVVEAHNGSGDSYEPRLSMVEVWNEPSPGGPYWTGTREDYFSLFRAVAERIHRDYPGVRVGGPSVLSSDGDFMLDFIRECGEVADFFTMHFYNQDPVLMARRIESWADYIADETGTSEAVLNVTESDNWQLSGADKIDYLLIRQFELIRRAHLIAGFHQFSLPYYRERADRIFGLIRPDGTVVAANYLPYWLFRGYEGSHLPVVRHVDGERLGDGRSNRAPLPLYATATTAGGEIDVVGYATAATEGVLTLDIRVPGYRRAYAITVDQLNLDGAVRTHSGETATPQDQFVRVEVDLTRGRAVRVHLSPVE